MFSRSFGYGRYMYVSVFGDSLRVCLGLYEVFRCRIISVKTAFSTDPDCAVGVAVDALDYI